MSHDPLHTPLKPRGWRERLRLRASPALLAFAVVLISLAGMLVWAWLQPAPAPRAVMAERELPPRPAPSPAAGLIRPAPPPASLANAGAARAGADQPAEKKKRKPAGSARILDVSRLPEEPAASRRAKKPSPAVVVDVAGAPRPLPPAPAPDLVEKSRHGPLPKAGRKGRLPWRVYAAPAPAGALGSARPKLAVLVTDLGLRPELTSLAIRDLPPETSLAFAPHARKVRQLGHKARRHGHEFFLQLPMEPWGYPAINPGPDTLLADADTTANRRRLLRLLARATGYVGITTYAGQKLLQRGEALSPVLHELKRRGLLVVEDGAAASSMLPALALVLNLPALRADVRLPPGLKDAQARALWEQALELARRRGHALVAISADDANLRALRSWLAELKANADITLVPVTTLARQKFQSARTRTP